MCPNSGISGMFPKNVTDRSVKIRAVVWNDQIISGVDIVCIL